MALNKQTFITRTTTAIIFAAVMLVGLLYNHWSFFILFSIIHFGCWWEYLKLTEKIHNTSFHIYTKLGLMLMGYAGMILFCGSRYQISTYSIAANLFIPLSTAGFLLTILGLYKHKTIKIKSFAVAALGSLYISLSCGFMISLWQSGFRFCQIYNIDMIRIPIILIGSLWINDTMAYIVGSLFGKTPLSKVSPKKTWEGTIGGIVLAIIIAAFLFTFIYHQFLFQPTMILSGIIAAIAAISGTFGDLLESKLKRMAGVKDSGSIMPGHGGFLDRFDSLLLATPFVWLYVYLFMR
jgi:phosphatidate cytidylyltransferase